MAEHDHAHEHENDEDQPYGMAIGIRLIDDAGEMFLVEVEITPYVDEPTALGATLVFHPLTDLDPTSQDDDIEWPALPTDIDDELERDSAAPMREQFQAILRQLAALDESRFRAYLQRARDEAAEDEGDDEE
jgi:hypothetical protein